MSFRRSALAIVMGAAVVGAGVGAVAFMRAHDAGPSCRVTSASVSDGYDLAQASNATTIASVGKRLGMPDHAITIALAAAMQESHLHNVNHGDRDSLGLFQQRPSQGWGTPAQVLTPHYAAAAFYQRLTKIDGWQSLSVNTAAQRVQHSDVPNGYGQWERKARALAIATTGEAAAALGCRLRLPRGSVSGLEQAMAQELGPPTIGVNVPTPRGWTVAAWLVAHAGQFGITSVTFAGQTWTPAAIAWAPAPTTTSVVQITRR